MDSILRTIASPGGRAARIAIGTSLIGTGLALGRKGWALSAVGLLPLAMGAFDWCLLAPLTGRPFDGPKLRQEIGSAKAETDAPSGINRAY